MNDWATLYSYNGPKVSVVGGSPPGWFVCSKRGVIEHLKVILIKKFDEFGGINHSRSNNFEETDSWIFADVLLGYTKQQALDSRATALFQTKSNDLDVAAEGWSSLIGYGGSLLIGVDFFDVKSLLGIDRKGVACGHALVIDRLASIATAKHLATIIKRVVEDVERTRLFWLQMTTAEDEDILTLYDINDCSTELTRILGLGRTGCSWHTDATKTCVVAFVTDAPL